VYPLFFGEFMYKKTYSELLRDPRWQKKRLEVLQFKDWTCESCYAVDVTFHVHHKHYVQGRNPWEYDADQLAVLCEDCHSARHDADKKIHDLLARADISGTPGGMDDLYWLIAGFLSSKDEPKIHSEKALYAVGVVAANECWLGFQGVEV
jgi:hypothetical protein